MRRKLIFASCAALLHVIIVGVSAQSLDEEQGTEAIITVEYGRVVRATLIVRYENDSIYIPVVDLFSLLKINNRFSMEEKTISGTFTSKNIEYELNFSSGEASVGSNSRVLRKNEFVRGAFDYFLLPSVFEEFFGITIRIQFRSLSAYITSRDKLPVLDEVERSKRWNKSSQTSEPMDAPLIGGFKTSWFNGGVLGYSIGASQSIGSPTYNYSLNSGFRFLGGDLNAQVMGSASDNFRTSTMQKTGRWRFVPDDNNILRQLTLGSLYSRGLRSKIFNGISISNEPLAPLPHFDDYLFEGTTEPGWDVEMYSGYALTSFSKADANGRYSFDIPLRYGHTTFQIKEYGPKGEYKESFHTLVVPMMLLPPGNITYYASGGKQEIDGYYFGEAQVRTGITSWLTAQIGGEYVRLTPESKPTPNGSLSLRLLRSSTLTIEAAPMDFYKAQLQLLLSQMTSFDLTHTEYKRGSTYSYGGLQRRTELSFNLPLQGILPLSVSIRSSRDDLGHSQNYLFNGNFSMGLSGFMMMGRYNGSFTYGGQSLQIGQQTFSASMNFMPSNLIRFFPFIFDGMYLSTSMNYDITRKLITSYSGSMSKRVFFNSNLSVSYQREMLSGSTQINVGFSLNLPWLRSYANLNMSEQSRNYNQTVQGAIALDAPGGRIAFTSSDWAGGGAATLRPFIDYNGNDRIDGDDQLMNGVRIRTSGGGMNESASGEIQRLVNIVPYFYVTGEVEKESLKNPLLIPKLDRFSFVAEPNFYKTIDIPFYVCGVVDGNVQLIGESGSTPVGGLRVLITSRDESYRKSVVTFSDGSFNLMGLKPGSYIARVDSQQLRLLNATSSPDTLQINIQATKDGDYIQGVSFSLTKVSKVKTLPMIDSIKAPPDTIIAAAPQKQNDTTLLASIDHRDLTRGEPRQAQKTLPQNERTQNTQIKTGLPKPDSASLALNEARIPVPEKNESLTSTHTFPLYTANSEDRSALISYLDSLALQLFAHTQLIVTVRGYSDNFGRTSAEIASSEERAKFVAEYLSKKGIEPSRIQTEARGRKNPIATNASEEGRMKNKRVEIEVVEKKNQ